MNQMLEQESFMAEQMKQSQSRAVGHAGMEGTLMFWLTRDHTKTFSKVDISWDLLDLPYGWHYQAVTPLASYTIPKFVQNR